MMFGHVETVEDRIEHLEIVRRQQDKSLARLNLAGAGSFGMADLSPDPIAQAGAFGQAVEMKTLHGGAFTAFICWTFQPENAVLKAQMHSLSSRSGNSSVRSTYRDFIS
jgi:2-iminoacetate synthase ThiH